MFWNKFPYTDFHELNLDWLLSTVKKLKSEFDSIQDKLTQLDEIEAYVKNYLDSIDWQMLADDAIQELYDNGDLSDLIAQYIQAAVTPTLDDLRNDLDNLAETVSGLRNAQGAYFRDSSSAAVHDLDFCYIDRTYDGDDSDGTKEKPFVSVNQAIEETFNKGIFCPNMRFLSGGNYDCDWSVFNGVTWHMSAYTAPVRPVIHFTNHNNLTFYNSHINWSGIDVIIDDPDYLFRAENCEIHIGDNVTVNRRINLASCGFHFSNSVFESFSCSNSKGFIEGTNVFNPAVLNAFVVSYNSDVTIEGAITINDSTYAGDSRAFYVFDNSTLYIATDDAPTIGAGHTVDIRINNSYLRCAPAIWSAFTRTSTSGINTIQTVSNMVTT